MENKKPEVRSIEILIKSIEKRLPIEALAVKAAYDFQESKTMNTEEIEIQPFLETMKIPLLRKKMEENIMKYLIDNIKQSQNTFARVWREGDYIKELQPKFKKSSEPNSIPAIERIESPNSVEEGEYVIVAATWSDNFEKLDHYIIKCALDSNGFIVCEKNVEVVMCKPIHTSYFINLATIINQGLILISVLEQDSLSRTERNEIVKVFRKLVHTVKQNIPDLDPSDLIFDFSNRNKK